jgi:hypothetical protein
MVEKLCRKDAKKGNFSEQMEFLKRSNIFFLRAAEVFKKDINF